MTVTYFDVFTWVASAALGFGTYDLLIRPVIRLGILRLKRRWHTARQKKTQQRFQEGVRWAWGMYGSGELSVNAISGWTKAAWQNPSAFHKGIDKAIEDIKVLEEKIRKQHE